MKKNENDQNNPIGSWNCSNSLYEAAIESDAIIILTEWEEFKNIDWAKISSVMRRPSWLFDTRNITNHNSAKDNGLKVWQLGKSFMP